MTQIKSYIKPCITIVNINSTNMLCSSEDNKTMRYVCSEFCNFGIYVKIEKKANFAETKNTTD